MPYIRLGNNTISLSMNALTTIVTPHEADLPYLRLSNADGKVWLMPQHRMAVGLQLYQPSSRQGQWLKRLLPYLHRLPFVRQAIKAEVVRLRLTPAFEQALQQVFGTEPYDIALFCGTPCVHQKITVQVSRGEQLLGYAKVSDNPEVITLFSQEADTLCYLHEQGVTYVPQALYCDMLGEGVGVFVQSTEKTLRSTTLHHWQAEMAGYLKDLHERTSISMPYEESDFSRDMAYLSAHLHLLPEGSRALLQRAIDIAHSCFFHGELHNTFSLYHGDFTPWNSYVEEGVLHLFDFEYAKRSYPPYLDFWHFYTQVSIFEQGATAEAIIAGITAAGEGSGLYTYPRWEHGQVSEPCFHEQMAKQGYLCYLLAIISHYTKREQGHFDAGIARNIDLYIAVITHLLQPKNA